MSTIHATVMVRNRVQIVVVLIVRSVVLLWPSNVCQHVHVRQWKVHVDSFLSERWIHVRIGVEPLEMNDEYGRKFGNVEFFDCFAGFLTMRALPAAHHFTVEVHIETICNMALIDVVRRQLQTEIRECFVGCAFVGADSALYGAFNLAVEETEDETFAGFCVF